MSVNLEKNLIGPPPYNGPGVENSRGKPIWYRWFRDVYSMVRREVNSSGNFTVELTNFSLSGGVDIIGTFGRIRQLLIIDVRFSPLPGSSVTANAGAKIGGFEYKSISFASGNIINTNTGASLGIATISGVNSNEIDIPAFGPVNDSISLGLSFVIDPNEVV